MAIPILAVVAAVKGAVSGAYRYPGPSTRPAGNLQTKDLSTEVHGGTVHRPPDVLPGVTTETGAACGYQ